MAATGDANTPAAPCELRVDKLKVSDSLESHNHKPLHIVLSILLSVALPAFVRKSGTRLRAPNP